jgi:hypothetical protein
MVAIMNVGCRVKGSHGKFLPSVCHPDGSQASRQKRARLQGTIMEAKGEKRWLVRFDNGLEKECPSVTLKMLNDPRYNRDSVASATISSVPNTSTCNASAPVALAPVSSAHDTLASVDSAPDASDPVALAAVASAHDTLASVASAPVTLDPVA